ncbi:HNH endonuclease, partial [Escherichia coli]|nr:HNH endonuclease [Escherichia coli]
KKTMNDFPPRPSDLPEYIYDACLKVTSKRPKTVIIHILKYGLVTTEELEEIYGYAHPPRAARDVRENGIPLKTLTVPSKKTGRMIGAYSFDTDKPVADRIGGRKSFPLKFKGELIKHYGSRSMLTGEIIDPRYLQIDHRIPYEIAGNDAELIVDNYMLLDASAQRSKSWSCENCQNFHTDKSVDICSGCFWAFPENYTHVAMVEERRVCISWNGEDVKDFDFIKNEADKRQLSVQDLIKKLISTMKGSTRLHRSAK